MVSSITLSHDPVELGELERAVLELIWQGAGQSPGQSAEQVREQLARAGRPLKESTIRTVLRRLEEKGYVAHEVDNRTFLYRPAETRQAVAGRAVQKIVDWFCEGSVEALLVGMVNSEVLDGAELQRLAGRIAAAREAESANAGKAKAGSAKAGSAKGGKAMAGTAAKGKKR